MLREQIELSRHLGQLVGEEIARSGAFTVIKVTAPLVYCGHLLQPHPRDDRVPDGVEIGRGISHGHRPVVVAGEP